MSEKPKRRIDLWVLGLVLGFGVIFIGTATWMGRQDRPERHLEAPAGPEPRDVRWAQGLGTHRVIVPRPLSGSSGAAGQDVSEHDLVVKKLRGTLSFREGAETLDLRVLPHLSGKARAVALGNLGLTRLLAGQVRAALSNLEEASLLAPDDRDILLLLALTKERLGSDDAALRGYEAVLARWPSDADALYRCARIDLAKGRPRKARARMDRCLDTARNWVDAQRLMGKIAWEMADYGRSRRAWLDVLQLAPGDEEATLWSRRIDGVPVR